MSSNPCTLPIGIESSSLLKITTSTHKRTHAYMHTCIHTHTHIQSHMHAHAHMHITGQTHGSTTLLIRGIVGRTGGCVYNRHKRASWRMTICQGQTIEGNCVRRPRRARRGSTSTPNHSGVEHCMADTGAYAQETLRQKTSARSNTAILILAQTYQRYTLWPMRCRTDTWSRIAM